MPCYFFVKNILYIIIILFYILYCTDVIWLRMLDDLFYFIFYFIIVRCYLTSISTDVIVLMYVLSLVSKMEVEP